jgi:hypothetical protein
MTADDQDPPVTPHWPPTRKKAPKPISHPRGTLIYNEALGRTYVTDSIWHQR